MVPACVPNSRSNLTWFLAGRQCNQDTRKRQRPWCEGLEHRKKQHPPRLEMQLLTILLPIFSFAKQKSLHQNFSLVRKMQAFPRSFPLFSSPSPPFFVFFEAESCHLKMDYQNFYVFKRQFSAKNTSPADNSSPAHPGHDGEVTFPRPLELKSQGEKEEGLTRQRRQQQVCSPGFPSFVHLFPGY